uniref:Hect ubiquitin-protein ligase, putative n=1 Tax=Arundo donax TaxID=35708 RepID=A0A0A9HDW8_ARUDO
MFLHSVVAVYLVGVIK